MKKYQKANNDKTIYLGVGVALMSAGFLFFISDGNWLIGLPLFVLGLVSFIVGFRSLLKKQ